MNKLLATTLIASAAVASAAPITSPIVQTDSYASLGTAGHTFSFNQFDSTLGTLTAVQFEIVSAVMGGQYTLQTMTPNNGAITFNSFGSKIYVYSTGTAGDSIDANTTETAVTFSNATLPTGQAKNTTVNYLVTSSQNITSGGATFNVTSGFFSNFIGNSIADVYLQLIPVATLTENAGFEATRTTTSLYSNTSVKLTYTFTPVPESSTYGIALGGLALAVVAIRRRKQVK